MDDSVSPPVMERGEEAAVEGSSEEVLQGAGQAGASRVESAGPTDACSKKPVHTQQHPLSLGWCFGFNHSLPVHNISEGNRKMIFYASSHTGVLFDCEANSQCLLQGHGNPITCTAVSGDRRWLVTADAGRDCMLIVWDSYSGIAVQTLFEGLGGGCAAVAMSHDALLIATLSTNTPQAVCVWAWSSEEGSRAPAWQTSLSPDLGPQSLLTFHPQDHTQLVSNSDDTVVFYCCNGSKLSVNSTPVSDRDFSKPVGVLTQTVFIPGSSSRALTTTGEGGGVVWETLPPSKDNRGAAPHIKRPIKLMKLHDSPITVLTTVNQLVVTGDSAGRIKFFDAALKLVNWYDHATACGPLASLSFAHTPLLPKGEEAGLSSPGGEGPPSEATLSAQPFVVPDLATSSLTATITLITACGHHSDVVLREHDAAVHALAAHPSLPWLLTGGYSCTLKLWDYHSKEVLVVRDFKEPNYIQCVAFDPRGEFIGVGFTSGAVAVLDPLELADVGQPFRYSRDCVTHIAFSHDSQYMATADLDLCVTVYTLQQGEEGEGQWQFMAKHRAHHNTIDSLLFGEGLDTGSAPRLLSLGRDRSLVEYDLALSSDQALQLHCVERIEQSATPTCLAWYPPLSQECFLLQANDQFKLKLFNSTTKMCRKTLLGPTFGSPIRKMAVLPALVLRDKDGEETRRYLAYITTDKVGLLLLPHDGNPHNSMCVVAHPGLVIEMVCSYDGQYLFTAGGEDCTVNMWKTNADALEAASLLGGEGLVPFYAMLEGGREGELFRELGEQFYYAQIRSQDPSTHDVRHAATTIPIEQIPYVMRAIGFFPSEQEVEDMLNEVKFSKYVDTGGYVSEIDLGTIIRLYVNHRPAFGLSPSEVGRAFKVLGERVGASQEWSLDRGKLLTLLQEKGEHVTETELAESLMTLLGFSEDPEVEGAFAVDPSIGLQDLPERISAADFAEDLLGLSTD